MSKVFRLYTEGTSTYQGWNGTPAFPYNSTTRDTIADPDGASAQNEITSIPSPFARIDLVKTAFKEVNKSGNLDGNTIFHKMVSDSLDVAEIFFNIDKFKNIVEVIKWDPQQMLAELDASDISGHRYLADALRKFINSDGSTYNFDKMRNIYFLNYINGPDELNIIGATSPATLFFSNANDLSYVTDIFFAEDRPFDTEYQPLYKRDFELIKYLFILRNTIPNFANLFPEFNDYLNLTYRQIDDDDKKRELREVNNNNLQQYSTINVLNNQQANSVEVLGHNLYCKTTGHISNISSEFTINSTVYQGEKPLVLPVEAGNKYRDLQYTTGKWGTTNHVDYYDPNDDLAQRTLPFDGAKKPYLTIGDFLEDYIAQVPHKLNKECYFDGNLNINRDELSYLIPLKPRFFEFFTVDDLMGQVAGGKNMIDMELLSGNSVKVILRIPIIGNANVKFVEYTRLYYNISQADIETNKGGMATFDFDGLIMPLIRFNNPNDAIYNISCLAGTSSRFRFSFYSGGSKLQTAKEVSRNEAGEYMIKATNYLLENSNFDIVRITNRDEKKGMIIPKFKPERNIEAFSFSIDLGTSNTHIEFSKNGGQSEVFKIEPKDILASEFFNYSTDRDGNQLDLLQETSVIEKDFVPKTIGDGDFKFPTRTVLASAKTTDWANVVEPYMLANIPFTYDKRQPMPYNNYTYNIKWGDMADLSVIDTYVRNLMHMIRNKVLLNNGDLSNTKITWFYPISMAPWRLNNLRLTWNNAFKKYFNGDSTRNMTESSAPIQYFFRRYATATDLVNVDIGGGTTDIAFAKNKKVEYVTSFRFATNNLFENPFSDIDNTNGIIDWFKGDFRSLLEEKRVNELVNVFDSESNRKPSNMASFLFGLKENVIARNNNLASHAIDFNFRLQQDEEFKIVFILFYSAIIYHIAQIVKAKGLDVPRHISFSGNGSKVIRIITADPVLLARYTKLIFEKVLGRPYGKELEILGLDNNESPKEATCKGGLLDGNNIATDEEIIIFKSDNSGFVGPNDKYDGISEQYKSDSVDAVKNFFDFVFNTLSESFNFHNNFKVSARSMITAQTVCEKDLRTYLEKGIEQRREESRNADVIEETFFFYPIKGAINAISHEINRSLGN